MPEWVRLRVTAEERPLMGALGDVTVLEVATGIAGPFAGMLLADHGAEVLKVEPPRGDPGRALPGDAVWNRGKRSVTTDLETAAGQAWLTEHLAGADVLLVSALPIAGTGWDAAALTERFPRLLVLVMPPYLRTDGSTPWVGGGESADLLGAATGIAYSQASNEDVPVDLVYPHVLYLQGIWAATTLVSALVERQHSGRGQVLTVGGVHGMAEASAAALVHVPGTPRTHQPGGPGGPVPFYRPYRCSDDQWLFLACLTPNFFMKAFEVLELLDLFADPRLEGDPITMLYPQNVPWVIERFAAVFATRTRSEWLGALADAGLPAAPLLDRDAWLDHPQLAAIDMRLELTDPAKGAVVMPGIPLVLTETPGAVRGPAPLPGEAGEGPVWPAREPIPQSSAGSVGEVTVRRGGPLEGLRVLDLGSIIAGTYACTLLAELGADVIKIEPPAGDGLRGLMLGFAGFHKGKRGIVLDLRKPGGHDAFMELARTADLVIDNYRPGVLERLGIDITMLRQVNPAISTVSVTGFGEGGPLGADPGFDPVLQAMSGMMTAQGGSDEPVFLSLPVNDVASAAMAALGAVLATFNRGRTGKGQRVWTSLAGQSALMQAGELVRYPGRTAARRGGRDYPGPNSTDRFYRTADGWIRLQATADAQRSALAGLLGSLPADEAERTGAIAAAFAKRQTAELLAALAEAGVPAAAARSIVELPGDPELSDFEVIHETPVAGDKGSLWTMGRMARLSRTETTGVLRVPGLGEHTREVLAETGLTEAAIDQLLTDGSAISGPPYSV
ncbi:MAG: CaiB/BaiF CoA transferase family protein [Microbacteriaceae bacterium]